jgi:hypothetical protein
LKKERIQGGDKLVEGVAKVLKIVLVIEGLLKN